MWLFSTRYRLTAAQLRVRQQAWSKYPRRLASVHRSAPISSGFNQSWSSTDTPSTLTCNNNLPSYSPQVASTSPEPLARDRPRHPKPQPRASGKIIFGTVKQTASWCVFVASHDGGNLIDCRTSRGSDKTVIDLEKPAQTVIPVRWTISRLGGRYIFCRTNQE